MLQNIEIYTDKDFIFDYYLSRVRDEWTNFGRPFINLKDSDRIRESCVDYADKQFNLHGNFFLMNFEEARIFIDKVMETLEKEAYNGLKRMKIESTINTLQSVLRNNTRSFTFELKSNIRKNIEILRSGVLLPSPFFDIDINKSDEHKVPNCICCLNRISYSLGVYWCCSVCSMRMDFYCGSRYMNSSKSYVCPTCSCNSILLAHEDFSEFKSNLVEIITILTHALIQNIGEFQIYTRKFPIKFCIRYGFTDLKIIKERDDIYKVTLFMGSLLFQTFRIEAPDEDLVMPSEIVTTWDRKWRNHKYYNFIFNYFIDEVKHIDPNFYLSKKSNCRRERVQY